VFLSVLITYTHTVTHTHIYTIEKEYFSDIFISAFIVLFVVLSPCRWKLLHCCLKDEKTTAALLNMNFRHVKRLCILLPLDPTPFQCTPSPLTYIYFESLWHFAVWHFSCKYELQNAFQLTDKPNRSRMGGAERGGNREESREGRRRVEREGGV